MKRIQKQIKKLNSRGVAHAVLPMLVILAVAAGGTYMLVRSNAMSADGYTAYERRIKHARAGSRTRIVLTARQQLGYAEKPVNKVKFFEWAGSDKPHDAGPWCSVFATWVWHAAGVRLDGQPYPMQSGVAQVRDTGKRDGRFHTSNPQPGDAILYGPGGSDHIGIVERVSGNKIRVIEGNAHLKGTEDKYVIRRTINLNRPRHIPHGVIYGYVSPPVRHDLK